MAKFTEFTMVGGENFVVRTDTISAVRSATGKDEGEAVLHFTNGESIKLSERYKDVRDRLDAETD